MFKVIMFLYWFLAYDILFFCLLVYNISKFCYNIRSKILALYLNSKFLLYLIIKETAICFLD